MWFLAREGVVTKELYTALMYSSEAEFKQIYFVITRRCNLFCSHCIRSSGPSISDYLSVTDARVALEKMQPYAKQAEVLISGGEPTLHSDFSEICKIACDLYPEVTVNTNGLRLSYLLKAATVRGSRLKVQISIDGDEPLHDKIRGKGTFKRSIKAIQELSEQGVHVTVATTVGQSNITSISNLDKVLESVDFSVWTIQREVVYGRAAFAKNYLNTNSWNKFAKNVKLTFKNLHKLSIATMFDWQGLDHLMKSKNSNRIRNCGTGMSKIYINPDLTVFPCGCLEQIQLGDLSKNTVSDIIIKIKEIIGELVRNPICKSCPFVSVCNGGCPGASYNYFGEFGKGDPRCPAINSFADQLYGDG